MKISQTFSLTPGKSNLCIKIEDFFLNSCNISTVESTETRARFPGSMGIEPEVKQETLDNRDRGHGKSQ